MTDFLAWKRTADSFFGAQDCSIERLRKPWPATAPYELVETSYFGFYVPEESLVCEIYHWIHPKFGLASGGIYLFKGTKASQTHADYLEYRNYMPMPEDITNCTYANGVTIKMIKPLEEFEISFDDPESDTRLRLVTRAIMPAAFRPAGGHITQAMKTNGVLVLRGKEYQISGYFSRDRSWGDPRSEKKLNIAPIGWLAGVFSDDLAFHVIAFDSPQLNPALARRYPTLTDGNNCVWGYVWKNGELRGIRSCKKQTQRETDQMAPVSVTLELTDEIGESHQIEGTLVARYPFSPWPMLPGFIGLTRWEYAGRTGFGETLDWLNETYILEKLG